MSMNDQEFPMSPELKTVRNFVNEDLRNAEVFFKHGIDFCCGANQSVQDACTQKGIEVVTVLNQLKQVQQTKLHSKSINFSDWDAEFMCSYIIHVHHQYLEKGLPLAVDLLKKFTVGHKSKFTYLPDLVILSERLQEELTLYLNEEQTFIFPYITKLARTWRRGEAYGPLLVRALKQPLSKFMDTQSALISKTLREIQHLCKDYEYASNACITHKVAFSKLKEVDLDIRQFFFLENDILFPRAIELEQLLLASGKL